MKLTAKMTAALAAGALALGLAGAATAQDYPSKPISMIVTWNAGGSTDVIARLLAEPLGEELGVPVAVANMAGGGGSLGTQAALDAPKDGYTILATTSGNHILTPLRNDVGYSYDDFEPIGQLVAASIVLAVRDYAPWQTLEEFVTDVQSKPGEYLFGAVPNVMPHLTLNALSDTAGLELIHVPQQGGAPGATALLAGDIDVLPANAATVASNIKAGEMRALAVFSPDRDPAFPDIPTAEEQGYAVYGSPFVGLAVAKGVPDEALETLRAAFDKVAQSEEFAARAQATATALTYRPAAAFGEVWARDWSTYAPMLQN